MKLVFRYVQDWIHETENKELYWFLQFIKIFFNFRPNVFYLTLLQTLKPIQQCQKLLVNVEMAIWEILITGVFQNLKVINYEVHYEFFD